MENQITPTEITQETAPVENIQQPQRFVMKIQRDNQEFILDYPSTASFHEAFNATQQFLLSVYDLSKQQEPQPVKEGEANVS